MMLGSDQGLLLLRCLTCGQASSSKPTPAPEALRFSDCLFSIGLPSGTPLMIIWLFMPRMILSRILIWFWRLSALASNVSTRLPCFSWTSPSLSATLSSSSSCICFARLCSHAFSWSLFTSEPSKCSHSCFSLEISSSFCCCSCVIARTTEKTSSDGSMTAVVVSFTNAEIQIVESFTKLLILHVPFKRCAISVCFLPLLLISWPSWWNRRRCR